MESEQFDRLSRSLAAVGTRRGLTRLLAVVPLLSGLLTFASSPTTAVAHGRRDKQRSHRGDTRDQRRHGATSRQHAHHDGAHAEKKKKKKKKKDKYQPPTPPGPPPPPASPPPPATPPGPPPPPTSPPPPPPPPPPPCSDGKTRCGEICVDTAGDFSNCGECGHVCDTRAGQECRGGVCGQPCGKCCFCVANSPLPDCCIESGCKNIATDVNNCGECGNVCDESANQCNGGVCTCGLGPACPTGVPCVSGHCFSCDGNTYDINNDPSDGCEQFDSALNHTQETATFLGNWTCFDTVVGQITGTIYSDTRTHVNSNDTQFAKSAPLWWKIRAIGGEPLCQNDVFISLVQTSGARDGAYKLILITDLSSGSKPIANGSAIIQLGAGSYSQGADIYIGIERSDLNANLREKADFGIIFHL